jgi:two-component system NarL family sensor kinase
MMELSGAVLEHANRGVRLQLLLRTALVVFLALTIVLIPPVQASGTLVIIVAVYAACAAVFMRWAWGGGPSVARWGWLGLFADLAVLTVLTLVSGVAAHESWTSDVLVTGFFLLPVLAATQLRPGICAAVVVPTTAVYAIASVATQAANEEPWQSIVLRTFMLASLGAAAVGLSRIQRSRVFTIGGLLEDRTGLLDDLVHLEERESRELSERLHDGALQYVLAARLDLDDVRGSGNEEAVDRIERALAESTRMLRSTVSELNPAVLEHAGLARAVQDLAVAQARGDLTVTVDADDWPDGVRTPVDALLFSAARELLANVVRHAGARHATITIGLSGDSARLVVTDDGKGITESARKASLDAGHIGLHSQRLRIEAAGGTLTVSGRSPGTVAIVVVPVRAADEVGVPEATRR